MTKRMNGFGLLFILPWMSWTAFAFAANEENESPRRALEAGEFIAELNGLKLWYKVSGTGPVCLMPTPAWGPSSDLYFRTLSSMEKIFTVVYLDSRGTGRSECAATAQEYTWDHLVADLEALRAHLEQEEVWMMGHSEGGVQVLAYACKYPERLNGMVLLDSLAVADDAQSADMMERAARRMEYSWYDDAMKALASNPTSPKEFSMMLDSILPLYWADPSVAVRFEGDFAATTLSFEAMVGQTESQQFPFDFTAQLKGVKVPTLIVVGDDDFICSPAIARRIHLTLPNSKLLLIEKSGHFPWMEQPAVFEKQVPEFLVALGLPAK